MRLFIACAIPDLVTRDVINACAAMRASVDDVRWVSPAHMHLTMKFLGERPDHDVARIVDAARDALTSVAPFEATIGAAGAFPNFSRPRVVWLGMEPSAPFATIAARLEHVLAPLGYPEASRPFTAHLTLGRIARPLSQPQRDALVAGMAQAFGGRREPSREPWREPWRVPVRELALFQSQHVNGALQYVPLRSIPLGER